MSISIQTTLTVTEVSGLTYVRMEYSGFETNCWRPKRVVCRKMETQFKCSSLVGTMLWSFYPNGWG